ncbi:hypothetical protein EDD11_006562 [Mortierella claussenii]|nr:hypothetical protein EDD11_006562 [Mortierella claussenii]
MIHVHSYVTHAIWRTYRKLGGKERLYRKRLQIMAVHAIKAASKWNWRGPYPRAKSSETRQQGDVARAPDEPIEDHTLHDATAGYGGEGGPEVNDDGSEIKGKRDLDGAEGTSELPGDAEWIFITVAAG